MTTIRDDKFVKEFSETLADLEALFFKLPDAVAGLELDTIDELAAAYNAYELHEHAGNDSSDAKQYAPPDISINLTKKYGFIIYSRKSKDGSGSEIYAGYLCTFCDRILTKVPKIIVERTHPEAVIDYSKGEFKYLYFCPVKKKYLPYPDLTEAKKSPNSKS